MENIIETNGWRIAWLLLILAASLAVFQFTSIDLAVQDRLFDFAASRWRWYRDEPVSRLLLYDGVKASLVVFWAGLGFCIMAARRSARLQPYRRGLRVAFATLLLVPLCVAGLKATTNIACPKDLARYGGEVEYVGIYSDYAPVSRPPSRQQCFPASHASGGFALFALFFLFRSKRNRRRAIYLGLAVGGVTGVYKMSIGDHFLSHTLVSMQLAWLIANGVALAESKLFRRVVQMAPAAPRPDGGHWAPSRR